MAIYNECAQLGGSNSNALILANIVIPNVVVQVITQIVNFDVKSLGEPFRSFSTVFGDLRLPFHLATCHFYIWIHLAECFSVVIEMGF